MFRAPRRGDVSTLKARFLDWPKRTEESGTSSSGRESVPRRLDTSSKTTRTIDERYHRLIDSLLLNLNLA